MKAKLLYWIPTVLVAALMVSSGITSVLRSESGLQVMRQLGYPDYFSVLLGVAKVLGVIAILVPGPRVLREWAYAGFTFDVIAAIVSLLAIGTPVAQVSFPVIALAFVLLSYSGWRRRLAASADVSRPSAAFAA